MDSSKINSSITGMTWKDTIISPATGVSARLYLPNLPTPNQKLPVLVYFHGGGFCQGSASAPPFHNYISSLSAKANLLAVSVDYRLAPQHPIPAAYDDCWLALQWIASHAADEWLSRYADFSRVFIAGESAGATIAHQVALRAGTEKIEPNVVIRGLVLIHPYFMGTERMKSEMEDLETTAKLEGMWKMVCPTTTGFDDPRINPLGEGVVSLKRMGCRRVLVCLAGKDSLRDRGRVYCEGLRESGWGGEVEVLESEGEGHVFHLFNRSSETALALDEGICGFLNYVD